MALESEHRIGQGGVREEMGDSEPISRPCSLAQVLCIQNDIVLFSTKVRDLSYGASPTPNLLGKFEQIICFSEPQLFLTRKWKNYLELSSKIIKL